MSEPALEEPVLETAVPEHDYLLRLAASDLGRACKTLAAAELGIRPGDVVDRAVADGYLAAESARKWLRHLTTQPFFAAVTLYILTAGAG
ncbi:MAG TPA: hypothetical protein VGQ05_19905 [Streptosporangiaceae bacterium]|nr:hypothetical protein [Streptosporangiaceae bacterium]